MRVASGHFCTEHFPCKLGNMTSRLMPPRLSTWSTTVEPTVSRAIGSVSLLDPCRQFGRDQTKSHVQLDPLASPEVVENQSAAACGMTV
jgi:hypothetical protein